ncbi:MAG TPA: hypothetical protein VFA34_05400 [Actinomycetota bacterium]|nr:hypothetical protein [Actinomycetota bacterium]
MGGAALLWAETPDDDRDETDEIEAHGDVDETFAVRRLRRWIKGMFGGRPAQEDEGEREPED